MKSTFSLKKLRYKGLKLQKFLRICVKSFLNIHPGINKYDYVNLQSASMFHFAFVVYIFSKKKTCFDLITEIHFFPSCCCPINKRNTFQPLGKFGIEREWIFVRSFVCVKWVKKCIITKNFIKRGLHFLITFIGV